MMPLPRRSIYGLIVALALANTANGQNIPPNGKVVLPAESFQARNRLLAIEQLLEPLVAPPTAAACVARLGLIVGPFDAAFVLAPPVAAKPMDLWEQLEEAYNYLSHDSGDALVNLSAAPESTTARTSLQIRRLCHIRLAELPPAALEIYRLRVDAEARRLLALGRNNRDPGPLRRRSWSTSCFAAAAARKPSTCSAT